MINEHFELIRLIFDHVVLMNKFRATGLSMNILTYKFIGIDCYRVKLLNINSNSSIKPWNISIFLPSYYIILFKL